MCHVTFKWKPNPHKNTWTQKRWGTHDLPCNHETLEEAKRDEAQGWAEYEAFAAWEKQNALQFIMIVTQVPGCAKHFGAL